MRWRRREEGENPAWPGLVDVFAFTLVFIMLLGFGSASIEEVKALREEVARLQKENARLREELEECRRGPWAKIKDKLKEIHPVLRKKLSKYFMVELKENELEIVIKGTPEISFDTAQYNIDKEHDRDRLHYLSLVLAETLSGQPFYILINGTADPRTLKDRGIPPHNNIQLSALRAANVSTLLLEAAPGLGDYLRIVGLGVQGVEVLLPPEVNPDEYYRIYRIVYLIIKVDVEKFIKQTRSGQ